MPVYQGRNGIKATGSGITSHGTGISSFTILWDQGPNFVTFFKSRIRNLGTKNGISDEKTGIPRYSPASTHIPVCLKRKPIVIFVLAFRPHIQ